MIVNKKIFDWGGGGGRKCFNRILQKEREGGKGFNI